MQNKTMNKTVREFLEQERDLGIYITDTETKTQYVTMIPRKTSYSY